MLFGFQSESSTRAHLVSREGLKAEEVEDRWYSPGATFFRALLEIGDRYVLRRDDARDVWSLTAFRAAGKRVDTKINRSV
jgi:hypothetical protein